MRLELARQTGEITFTVRDTGIGIAKRDVERLFRPFAQLDAGLTRRHGGTGLGLYISRGLAELLGGRIEFESNHGEGSSFPRAADRQPIALFPVLGVEIGCFSRMSGLPTTSAFNDGYTPSS